MSEPVSELRIERVDYGHADALRLIAQVQLEYVARYGSTDDTPLDPSMFASPSGSFFVGYLDDEPVASGAWRRRDDVPALGVVETAEIKRMYVVPAAQRQGVARRMLAYLESTARQAGADAMVLETGSMQPEAIALYESSGYVRIAPFGHYRDSPVNRCFAMLLD
ncbi:MAG: GNAT family N-acetyltransferase [Nocardioides sp.]|nr:GNAT family N-acetyltransferase [Nocardioides sp.]